MPLLERQAFLDELARRSHFAAEGSGQAVFLCGEAGIGKTALSSTFLESLSDGFTVVRGYCDALATPHALGPVYEVWSQLIDSTPVDLSRDQLFSRLCARLQQARAPYAILIEDLHWADEATLDFIRYLARRLAHWSCLLIATYRDDEAGPEHPLTRVIGDLTGSHVSRLQLSPLSQAAVTQLAATVGRDGARIYTITGGNAFFVRELLSAPPGSVPATVRDSMLARLARCSADARQVSEFVALAPGRMETELLIDLLGPSQEAVDECVERGILVHERGALSFRHELARRAIEDAVAPARSQQRHARILEALLDRSADIARIVHHARGARDDKALLQHAPLAGARAASVGAHREAAAYYAAALEFANRLSLQARVHLHEKHAYECYLTSQINDAIASARAALDIWRQLGERQAQGRTLRFLSRQHWFLGDRASAERYAHEAIAMHETFAPDRDLAMAYSSNGLQQSSAARDAERARKRSDRVRPTRRIHCA